MKIDPKYAFLHAFFLIFPSCPFQNLSIWPKTHLFFQFCTFLHPVRAYSAWSWKTTLLREFLDEPDTPLTFECPPPPLASSRPLKYIILGTCRPKHVSLSEHCPLSVIVDPSWPPKSKFNFPSAHHWTTPKRLVLEILIVFTRCLVILLW